VKTLKLALAWLIVGIPLAWGVYHSVRKSLPLFKRADAPAPVVAPR